MTNSSLRARNPPGEGMQELPATAVMLTIRYPRVGVGESLAIFECAVRKHVKRVSAARVRG